MKTCVKCNKIFSTTIKIDGITRNLCNRKYCLECSEFNKHNTRKLHNLSNNEFRICKACNQTLPLDQFYKRRFRNDAYIYCKTCVNKQAIFRQQEFKRKCVEYKGSKCEICRL